MSVKIRSDVSYHRIFMGEVVIHSQKDHHVVLATDGLRSCIGFGGWEPEQKVGFLVHFGGPMQVHDFYSRGIKILSEKCLKQASVFHCAIKGGCEKTSASKEIVEAIRQGLNSCPYVQFQIVEEEPLSEKFTLKSLSLYTENGVFSDYDSASHLNARQKTIEEQARDLTFSSFEQLVYRY